LRRGKGVRRGKVSYEESDERELTSSMSWSSSSSDESSTSSSGAGFGDFFSRGFTGTFRPRTGLVRVERADLATTALAAADLARGDLVLAGAAGLTGADLARERLMVVASSGFSKRQPNNLWVGANASSGKEGPNNGIRACLMLYAVRLHKTYAYSYGILN
jgi:hypothetical protein